MSLKLSGQGDDTSPKHRFPVQRGREMSEFVVPVVGTDYLLDGERVTVVEALKKRYWRIVVGTPDFGLGDGKAVRQPRTIPEAEWRAKAANVGAGS